MCVVDGAFLSDHDVRHLIHRPRVGQMNALLGWLTGHGCRGEPCGLVTTPGMRCC